MVFTERLDTKDDSNKSRSLPQDANFQKTGEMKSIQIGGFLVIFTWKAKCPIFKAIVAGFRGKVA